MDLNFAAVQSGHSLGYNTESAVSVATKQHTD